MTPQVDKTHAILLVALQFFDPRANSLPRSEGFVHRRSVATGKGVQQRQSRRPIECRQGFVLRVDRRKGRSELPQDGDGGRLIIDKDPTLAAARDLPPQNDGITFRIESVLFQNARHGLGRAALDFKHGRYDRAIGPRTDDVRGSFFAQKQGQSIDKNGFSGAGLACQQVEPRGERNRQIIDHRVVLEAQFDEHRWSWK